MENMRRWIRLTAIVLLLAGCSKPREEIKTPDESKTAPEAQQTLTLATTTSTRDSGLLDALVPMFEKETGIQLKVVAVGSGQALALGRRGDADVLLTHAPEAEEKFMAKGYGEQRRSVMHNDFVVVGPKTDPAQIAALCLPNKQKTTSGSPALGNSDLTQSSNDKANIDKKQDPITEAFQRIAKSKSPFVSRGDNSGTHMKERKIWREAKLEPKGTWYIQAGAGMAEVLRIANEKRAYTLTDRGTYLSQRDRLDLKILFEGDPLLQNPYTVIVISSKKHPSINNQGAARFAEFLVSPKVQQTIGKFGIEKFGQPLFFPLPSAGK